jgi:hypothetical protein
VNTGGVTRRTYRYRWPASQVGATPQLLATARDLGGNESTFTAVVQIVADDPAQCSFAAPAVASLTVEEGTRLNVEVQASDDHIVSSVELRLDGRVVARQACSGQAQCTLQHTLALAKLAGSSEQHTLDAVAIDDRAQPGSAPPSF